MHTLIQDYHRQKVLPVFTHSAHEQMLADFIEDFTADRTAALRRFAAKHGFCVIEEDWGF